MASKVCTPGPGSENKPDILLLAENGHAGGIGRYCVDLAQALQGSVSLACLCPEVCSGNRCCWLAEQCRARDLRLVSIAMPKKAWKKGLQGLTALWKAEGRPIVHVNGRKGNFAASLAKSFLTGFVFATTVHGVLGLHARRNAAYRMVDLAASHLADAVIAVNADTRRRLVAAGVPSVKILTITNGVSPGDLMRLTALADIRGLRSRLATNPRVGFLGRLSVEKGIREFVRLAQVLSTEGVSATFVVAGDGPLHSEFLEQSKALVADGRLEYLGDVSDPIRILGNIDVLVVPSHNEGLPYVLLEGMAAGCAIVAYAVGGIPEVVADHSLGCLVRPQDSDGLVNAVSLLLAQPSATLAMGARASAHVRKRFSLSGRLPELLKAYERCDAERASRIAKSCVGGNEVECEP